MTELRQEAETLWGHVSARRPSAPGGEGDADGPPAPADRWRSWFCFAVLRLGIDPQTFWTLTVREWRWLIDAAFPGGGAMDAAALQSLLQQYPDKKNA